MSMENRLRLDTEFADYHSRTTWTKVKHLLNPWTYLRELKRMPSTYPRRFWVLVMALTLHFRPQSL